MFNIEKAFKDNRLSKALTGMTINEIDNLVITFEKAYLQEANSKKRIRKLGGGRKGSLPTLQHKLFFILFYNFWEEWIFTEMIFRLLRLMDYSCIFLNVKPIN